MLNKYTWLRNRLDISKCSVDLLLEAAKPIVEGDSESEIMYIKVESMGADGWACYIIWCHHDGDIVEEQYEAGTLKEAVAGCLYKWLKNRGPD